MNELDLEDKLLSQGYHEIMKENMSIDSFATSRRMPTKNEIIVLFNEETKDIKFLKLHTRRGFVTTRDLSEMTLEDIQEKLNMNHPVFKMLEKIEQAKTLDEQLPLNEIKQIKPKL